MLIETILAAFEMEEILYELREHSAGLNAGRWDYIFSAIKKFRNDPAFCPDRAQVTMTVPFMRAYTELLVKTCHRRGAHAMGGMAAFIPSRRNPEINETALARVREDKERESGDGFDGTWVAHPDLVPVATEVFDAAPASAPTRCNGSGRRCRSAPLSCWPSRCWGRHRGRGAGQRLRRHPVPRVLAAGRRGAAINNLMEDAATAEISRSQIWQWLRKGVTLEGGPPLTRNLVQRLVQEELATIRQALGEETYARGRFEEATRLFQQVSLSEDFAEFLTLPAYEVLER